NNPPAIARQSTTSPPRTIAASLVVRAINRSTSANRMVELQKGSAIAKESPVQPVRGRSDCRNDSVPTHLAPVWRSGQTGDKKHHIRCKISIITTKGWHMPTPLMRGDPAPDFTMSTDNGGR